MRHRVALTAASFALVLLASCGGGGGETVQPEATTSAPISSATGTASATAVAPGTGPDAMITSPKHGATISGTSVKVKLDVDNFDVVDKVGDKRKDGEGHVHFYLDVPQIPTTQGEEAIVEGTGRYVAKSSTTHTWKDLTAGQHVLGAQLVNNDHTPLQPPVTAQITVTVNG
jgi:hypothetical protein